MVKMVARRVAKQLKEAEFSFHSALDVQQESDQAAGWNGQ
jgi:hypothetical protein